jgi:hypothetical protein
VAQDGDCDGIVMGEDCDDADALVSGPDPWYFDADGDGYGNALFVLEACALPNGYVDNSDDCDDLNAALQPDTVWYFDADGDGYGDADFTTISCEWPSGYADNSDDCDPLSATVYPQATEIACDGIDQDCDGIPDDKASDGTMFYVDADGDGYGDIVAMQYACSGQQPSGFVEDCSDLDDNEYCESNQFDSETGDCCTSFVDGGCCTQEVDSCGVCGGDNTSCLPDGSLCSVPDDCQSGICDACYECGGDNPEDCKVDGESCFVYNECESDYRQYTVRRHNNNLTHTHYKQNKTRRLLYNLLDYHLHIHNRHHIYLIGNHQEQNIKIHLVDSSCYHRHRLHTNLLPAYNSHHQQKMYSNHLFHYQIDLTHNIHYHLNQSNPPQNHWVVVLNMRIA